MNWELLAAVLLGFYAVRLAYWFGHLQGEGSAIRFWSGAKLLDIDERLWDGVTWRRARSRVVWYFPLGGLAWYLGRPVPEGCGSERPAVGVWTPLCIVHRWVRDHESTPELLRTAARLNESIDRWGPVFREHLVFKKGGCTEDMVRRLRTDE